MKNKQKTKKTSFFTIVVSVLFAAIVLCMASFYFMLSPRSFGQDVSVEKIEVPSGAGVKSVASMLAEKKLIRSGNAFYLAVRCPFVIFRFDKPVIKSGVYTVKSSMSVKDIISLLDSGEQEFIRTVIPEGLTMRKIAFVLEDSGVCPAESFLDSCRSESLLAEYGIPGESFEGFLFPDTYFFTPSMKAESVVRLMVENFFDHVKLIPGYETSPADFYETLVLASIVEREYQVESEAPLIASVFKNRIKAGVGLYSCATVEYIITEIQLRPHPEVITYEDTQIDSPYNTYKWAALPPGPISNPGSVALSAAANAPDTDYFYFVLLGDGTGGHRFSRTQSEHERAIISYRTKKAAGSK